MKNRINMTIEYTRFCQIYLSMYFCSEAITYLFNNKSILFGVENILSTVWRIGLIFFAYLSWL